MNSLTYAIIGGMFGAIVTGFVMRQPRALEPTPQPASQPAMMMAGMPHDMGKTMDGMVQALQGKTGDDFDKTFLSEMIVHHQGAIDMAKLASGSAKHAELKQMTDAIITTQTKEIEQMKTWQKEWGY